MSQGQDWDRYWAGRGKAGEAFAGEGVERHPALEAHWTKTIAEAPQGAVLDIAAGAGSVAKLAAGAGRATTATDISTEAMGALRASHPAIDCTTASADALPFEAGRFALVTSQFGIEYAPEPAFAEAVRVLEPGGVFSFLIHHQGGVIEKEVRGHRASAEALLASGLFEAARSFVHALSRGSFASEKAAYDRAEREAAESQSPVAAYTIQGFRQLASRHANYAPSDITGWLDGMKAEAEAYLGRMQSMEAAARSADDLGRIAALLEEAGAEKVESAPFHLDAAEGPAAWQVRGLARPQ